MGEFSSASQPDRKPATLAIPPSLARWLPRIVLLAQAVVSVALVRAWLNGGTYQLYLADRADAPSSSDARQRFVVEGARVVPQILTHESDGFRFLLPDARRGELRFRARTGDRATIQVSWADGQRQETLGRRELAGQDDIAYRLPAPGGALDLSSQGTVVWSELRVEEAFPWWPHATMLALLFAVGWLLPRSHARFAVEWTARERFVIVRMAAIATAAVVALAALEAVLRVAAWASPPLMAIERSRLGEVAPDPHWRDSQRYGRVPRPNRNAMGEWTLGDIVRMGFVPEEKSPALLHRFPVRTDAEGFRNDTAPAQAEVAALGDSFTDALTLPVELGWPARLERRLGRSVRNYGVAGFGPQQELRVLRDRALPRGPRVVVVAFFAGNDIPGAALFEEFERSGGASSFGVAGWPFKRVVARFDRSYAYLLGQHLLGRDVHAAGPDAAAAGGRRFDAAFSGEDPAAPAVERPSFDRGMFALPVGGRTLRFALMPPYLNLLNLGPAELAAHRGWDLTRASLREMDLACRQAGARLVVMFIPSKSQAYLPLLERALAPDELRRALAFSLPDDPRRVDVRRLLRNRLVQNELVGSFCRREGIAFLDLTPDLASAAARGDNVYFPDDSHWNARGHQVAADRLAGFLAEKDSLCCTRPAR
jgi:lysophospholipase L1-like esterase